jgi:hypothetical protein
MEWGKLQRPQTHSPHTHTLPIPDFISPEKGVGARGKVEAGHGVAEDVVALEQVVMMWKTLPMEERKSKE